MIPLMVFIYGRGEGKCVARLVFKVCGACVRGRILCGRRVWGFLQEIGAARFYLNALWRF